MTIEVDTQVAEILRRIERRAREKGQTLGAYLEKALPADLGGVDPSQTAQGEAWHAFLAKGRAATSQTASKGHVVDDSREAMYRDEW